MQDRNFYLLTAEQRHFFLPPMDSPCNFKIFTFVVAFLRKKFGSISGHILLTNHIIKVAYFRGKDTYFHFWIRTWKFCFLFETPENLFKTELWSTVNHTGSATRQVVQPTSRNKSNILTLFRNYCSFSELVLKFWSKKICFISISTYSVIRNNVLKS